MKKILYCITKGNFGGAQKYVYDLAVNMDKNQYEVTVLCGEGEALPRRLQEKNIRVIRMNNMKRNIGIINEIKSFIEIYKIFKKEKPDIIHLNSSKMGGIGSFIGRIIGIKNIIFTAHGFAFNEDRSFISRKIILFFHWLTILLTHKTIVVSDKTKSGIEYLPFIKNKLIRIYNGIDTNLEFYDKEKSREILLKNKNINIENKITLLSIGELHKNKGFDLFIKYLTELDRDFIYLIIGDGEERDNIETIIQDNNLTNKAYLIGRIEDAYKYVKSADIFILPSRTEAFPYVLLESGLGNSAVLASRVGGISEIIIENETGLLFDIYDKNNCLNQLRRLIDDKDLRNKLAINIHDKIVNEFSQDKMIKETIEVYNK
jgi:glycosyltransferase involved in cell wall biosynthesis